MRPKIRPFHFEYHGLTADTDVPCVIPVTEYDTTQPKAEMRADRYVRIHHNNNQRLPWHVLRRDLVSVGEG